MRDIKPQKISLDDAISLVLNFLKQDRLFAIGTKNGIGGILQKESLIPKKALGAYYGKMFWFCENNNPTDKFPKIFLAVEDGEYSIEQVPNEPSNDQLTYGKKFILYDQPKVDSDSVRSFLQNGFNPSEESDEKISKTDCIKMLSHVAQDKSGANYNKYYCSFFEYTGFVSDEFARFMEQPNLAYVACLFGYDDSHQAYFDSNRIRVILMGLDSTGKPISVTEELTDSTMMLQHSWPPPPPNTQV